MVRIPNMLASYYLDGALATFYEPRKLASDDRTGELIMEEQNKLLKGHVELWITWAY